MSFNDIQKFAGPAKGNFDDSMFVSEFQKLQLQLVPWHDMIDNLAKCTNEFMVVQIMEQNMEEDHVQ